MSTNTRPATAAVETLGKMATVYRRKVRATEAKIARLERDLETAKWKSERWGLASDNLPYERGRLAAYKAFLAVLGASRRGTIATPKLFATLFDHVRYQAPNDPSADETSYPGQATGETFADVMTRSGWASALASFGEGFSARLGAEIRR